MLVVDGTAISSRRTSTARIRPSIAAGKKRKNVKRRDASRQPSPPPRNVARRMKLEKYARSRMYAGIQRIRAISRKRTRKEDRKRDKISAGPSNDEIGCRRRADVRQVVQFVRGLKNDPARLDSAFRPALERLECAFLEDDQLFVFVLVRRMRRLARIERRDVDLELSERGRRHAGHLPHFAPVVGLGVRRRPFPHGGFLELPLRRDRRGRTERGGDGQQCPEPDLTHTRLQAACRRRRGSLSTRPPTRCPDSADQRRPSSTTRSRSR